MHFKHTSLINLSKSVTTKNNSKARRCSECLSLLLLHYPDIVHIPQLHHQYCPAGPRPDHGQCQQPLQQILGQLQYCNQALYFEFMCFLTLINLVIVWIYVVVNLISGYLVIVLYLFHALWFRISLKYSLLFNCYVLYSISFT